MSTTPCAIILPANPLPVSHRSFDLLNRILKLAADCPRHFRELVECADEIAWDLTGRGLVRDTVSAPKIEGAEDDAADRRAQAQRAATALVVWAELHDEHVFALRSCAEEINEVLKERGVPPRDAVLGVLESWASVTVAQIVRETELSAWKVRQILAGMIEAKLVDESGPGDVVVKGGVGDRVKLYALTHSKL